jgi:hypothetical protein
METIKPTATLQDQLIAPKLSAFLKVLCILTIIGSAYGILGSGIAYINRQNNIQILEKAQADIERVKVRDSTEAKKGFGGAVLNFASNAMEISKHEFKNIVQSTVVKCTMAILCIIGAVLMLKRKRIGFFVYLIGEIGAVIYAYILYGGLKGGSVFIAYEAIIAIVFIFLYSTNYKKIEPNLAAETI